MEVVQPGPEKYSLTPTFWDHVDKRGTAEYPHCWIWIASRVSGYGKVWSGGKLHRAHRLLYEVMVEPIEAQFQLDHLCRNRACVNPAHLEPVTNRENTMRGDAAKYKTHCRKGHEFKEGSFYLATGRSKYDGKVMMRRVCKACRKVMDARRYAERVGKR